MASMDTGKTENCAAVLDATGVYYRELNERVRSLTSKGSREITLEGVNGQRYIGCGLRDDVRITIDGVPGNDLGAFMDGPTIIVDDNAQDGVGNTMNGGKIVVKGNAGDVLGYAMRGGKVFVKGDVGYRVGIHMKSFKEQVSVIVVGGRAGDFFGEYMAGGILVLIGLGEGEKPVAGDYLGTGMHGGVIFVRGSIEEDQLGREVRVFPISDEEREKLTSLLKEFSSDTETDVSGVDVDDFVALKPFSHRPYGNLYVY